MKRMTDAELRERLGEYFAPQGLYQKTKDMPFLGRVACSTDTLTAGEWTEIVLDYEVGASGMADGAWFKATFKFYSDWALFQTADPAGANYVSAEYQAGPCVPGQSPATVQSLKVRFDQKGHERPFQKAVIVDTVDGYLKPGDHIVVRMGDRRFGGPGTRVQTFVEKGFRFRCYCDPLGTSRFAAVAPDLAIDIVPGRPAAIEMAASRIVRRGTAFPLRVRTEGCVGQHVLGRRGRRRRHRDARRRSGLRARGGAGGGGLGDGARRRPAGGPGGRACGHRPAARRPAGRCAHLLGHRGRGLRARAQLLRRPARALRRHRPGPTTPATT